MNNKRLLFLSMVALTLCIGVIIGSIVSGGVKATFEQKPATIVIPDPVSLSNAFSQIAAQLEPAVVKIEVQVAAPPRVQQRNGRNNPQIPNIPGFPPDLFGFGGPDQNPRDRVGKATGTGFIVDKAGYILTNHHVVDRATKITVFTSDDSQYVAKLIGSDEGTDLGLIKIDAGHDLATAKFGNSDAVKVGDWVLAIGSPFGFDHSVTSGIISAKGRDNSMFGADQQFRGLQRFLQTDAAINPGNSGGPLVNMSGEVIGINTAIVSGTDSFAGLGFALPSNTAVKVYNQLSQSGKVTRGSIGITYSPITDPTELDSYGIKAKEAIIVENVLPGTPAEKAGLRQHDIITEINGTKVTKGNQLQDVIVDSPVGSIVKLGFMRDGRSQTVSVTIGDRADVLADDATASSNIPNRQGPRGRQEAPTQSRLGIQVQSITAQMSRQFGGLTGVEVTDVDPNNVADEAGIEVGMFITGVVTGGRTVEIKNAADFRGVESQLRSGSSVTLLVKDPDAIDRTVRVPMKVK
jgi:serine protease Do